VIITRVFDASQATSHSDIGKKISNAQGGFDGTTRDRREDTEVTATIPVVMDRKGE